MSLESFLNLTFYHLLQPWLYLLPLAFEKPVKQRLLLIEKAEVICCKPVGCLLLL